MHLKKMGTPQRSHVVLLVKQESLSIYSLGGQATLEDAWGYDKAIDIINYAGTNHAR
jgi:hypothetical protein